MSGHRRIFTYAVRSHLFKTNNKQLLSFTPTMACAERAAHTQRITNNIQYISNDSTKLSADPQTMKLSTVLKRPVCLMMTWLRAPHKHIMKYADIYLEEGFDVLTVSCDTWQLMWPVKGAKLIAWDLLRLMAANDTSYMVHGFSVGGYVWSEALVHAINNKPVYQPVLERVAAQVWDSVADITEVTVGVPRALFPKNKLVQKLLTAQLELYMKAFKNIATVHYKFASDTYYATPCRAPALFLLSSTDPVGNETRIRNAHDTWCHMGLKCTWQCWPRSPHVQHYYKHRDEYLALLKKHIRDNFTSLGRVPDQTTDCNIERVKRASNA